MTFTVGNVKRSWSRQSINPQQAARIRALKGAHPRMDEVQQSA